MKIFKQISIHSDRPELLERVVAACSDLDFEGIEENDQQISITFKEENFDEETFKTSIEGLGLEYKVSMLQDRNWNAEWESGFEPVNLDDKVLIRAKFHPPVYSIQYDIIITPKMSFGTGHHATTSMMVRLMQHLDFVGKSVLDFGTGTGILAILARKLGAGIVMATDNDEWSISNARENVEENGCDKITVELKQDISNAEPYDIVLANINLNVLTANAESLSKIVSDGGYLLVSGFYALDAPIISQTFENNSFNLFEKLTLDNWSCVLFRRKG